MPDDPFGSVKINLINPASSKTEPGKKESASVRKAEASQPLPKVLERRAAEICRAFELSDQAKALLQGDLTIADYLPLLQQHRLYVDAVKLLAHALPKREAIRWASLCARRWAGDTPAKAVTAALTAVDQWLADPNEEHRRAAMTAAEAVGFGTPAGCAALAVFWSGGSLGPPNVPVIPPGEHLTSQGAANAVILAAVLEEPEKAPAKFHCFLEAGLQLVGVVPS